MKEYGIFEVQQKKKKRIYLWYGYVSQWEGTIYVRINKTFLNFTIYSATNIDSLKIVFKNRI